MNKSQISKETKIMYEPQILEEHHISKQIQITNEPELLKITEFQMKT